MIWSEGVRGQHCLISFGLVNSKDTACGEVPPDPFRAECGVDRVSSPTCTFEGCLKKGAPLRLLPSNRHRVACADGM